LPRLFAAVVVAFTLEAAMAHNNIQYSEKYYDDVFEYR
jgi:hypothetical protein